MIEIKNLVKKYGSHVAVDHLNLQIEKGKIYGFLGPNGAGKSTTMNIMTGYLGATEGDVVINGHSISNEPEEAKRCIGYLPEIPPLYVEMRVMEYLTFVAELKKIKKSEREKAIEEAIEIAKLQEVKTRLIKNLSKGYKQRVGLAQAVLGMPEVIILDEPTVGLDPKQIIEIRDVIKNLGKQHTVILSSHIMQEVSAVCDYIMIISHGKLVASDTPENLETMWAGTNTLALTVKADQMRIAAILKQLQGIQEVKYKKSEEEGMTEVEIVCEGKQDIREQVFFAFAQEKCPIVAMSTSKASLEDIFLQLTEAVPEEEASGKRSKKKRNNKKNMVANENPDEEQQNEERLDEERLDGENRNEKSQHEGNQKEDLVEDSKTAEEGKEEA